jgi:serine/threonine protein kinase
MRRPGDLVGKKFGSLLVIQLLGRGVASRVYEVSDGIRPYALKLFRPGFEPDNDASAHKARAKLRELAHPNLCRFFKLDQIELRQEVHWYALLELIRGRTLQSVLRGSGALSFADFQPTGLQLMEGLLALQHANLSHGDIKPSNIMIEELTGRVILTDFDLITERHKKNSRRGPKFRGSVQYAAPECLVLATMPADVRADTYSLGLTLFEMIAGRALFRPGISIVGRFRALNRGLDLERAGYPKSILQLVELMLSNSPKRRPDLEYCHQKLLSSPAYS